jgi:hypothetical protein
MYNWILQSQSETGFGMMSEMADEMVAKGMNVAANFSEYLGRHTHKLEMNLILGQSCNELETEAILGQIGCQTEGRNQHQLVTGALLG